jgi:RNA polymerase sigma factor (sigma-70 family)
LNPPTYQTTESTMNPSDGELMHAVQSGDLSQLGVLFERYHVAVYRYCLRMTSKPSLSEDMVQEAFTRVLKYARTFREGTNFRAWMFRVARNVCNDHYRKHRRETPLEEPEKRVSEEPLVAETLEHEEDLGRLRVALEQLPEDRRELLILSRFERRKYDEIAQLLDCSVGAVKVRVHRAMKQLRDIYLELASEATL